MTNPKHVELLEQSKAHYVADMLIKGTFGNSYGDFKGCSIGCHAYYINQTIPPNAIDDVHTLVSNYYEYPKWLAYLQDTVFEGLPDGENREWHVQLAQAIHDTPEVDWQMCLHRVHVGVLQIAYTTAGEASEVVQSVIELHEKAISGENIDPIDWAVAEAAAWSAEETAWSAEEASARAAARSAEEASAWAVARSVARAAEEAAWAVARSVARAAEETAWSAEEVSAAGSAAYQEIRDVTLKAIEESAQ